MITKFKTFELKSDNNPEYIVLDYLNLKMREDKKEYKGDIPTKYNPGSKWSDREWYIDEIMQFLQKSVNSSYTSMKYGKKFDYEILNDILKRNFKEEYKKAEENLER